MPYPWPPPQPEPYFTCKCNPSVANMTDDTWPLHRIPIDCMTAEDWQRVAREKQERAATVWVVSVIGDEDCGAPNEGAIGVFENKPAAWLLAMTRAAEISPDDISVEEDKIEMGYARTVIEVNKMEVQ